MTGGILVRIKRVNLKLMNSWRNKGGVRKAGKILFMETYYNYKIELKFDFVKIWRKIYNKIIIDRVINCPAIDVYGSLFENLMVKYTSCAKSIYIYRKLWTYSHYENSCVHRYIDLYQII